MWTTDIVAHGKIEVEPELLRSSKLSMTRCSHNETSRSRCTLDSRYLAGSEDALQSACAVPRLEQVRIAETLDPPRQARGGCVTSAKPETMSTRVRGRYRRGDMFEKRSRLMCDWAAYCASAGAAGTTVTSIRGATG